MIAHGQPASASSASRRAALLVADTIGDLMAFWNFKPSMGRVWAVLYLSRRPLSADEIVEITGLSAGSVSMTLHDLQVWGVVRRVPQPDERRRYFDAETDILRMITHTLRQRELRLVDETIARLEEAARILDEEGRSSIPEEMMENRFLATRVHNLVSLARVGRRVIDQLVHAGTLDLGPIRGTLGRRH